LSRAPATSSAGCAPPGMRRWRRAVAPEEPGRLRSCSGILTQQRHTRRRVPRWHGASLSGRERSLNPCFYATWGVADLHSNLHRNRSQSQQTTYVPMSPNVACAELQTNPLARSATCSPRRSGPVPESEGCATWATPPLATSRTCADFSRFADCSLKIAGRAGRYPNEGTMRHTRIGIGGRAWTRA
jgi:hypothetical protein